MSLPEIPYDEWFDNKPHPHDVMPIATDNPRPEEEMADWFRIEKPDESDEIEEEKTMHQKMYEIATSKYNPFSVGGSESLGGSEEVQK